MYSLLLKPYPCPDNTARALLRDFLISGFIIFFLNCFQPFGIWGWNPPNKLLLLSGYGLVSFITLGLYEMTLRYIISVRENWRVWKEIVFTLIVVLCIAVGNFLYSYQLGIAQFNSGALLSFVGFTFLVAVFPVTTGVIGSYYRYMSIHGRKAAAVNTELQKGMPLPAPEKQAEQASLTFVAENEKDTVQADPQYLLYISSADNYCVIVQQDAGRPTKTMLRSSLRRLEEQHSLPYLCRCHRSYIVNLRMVKKVEGNAQGYKLYFEHTADTVPVSRSYAATVLARLGQLQKA